MGQAGLLFQGYQLTPEVVSAWFEIYKNHDPIKFQIALTKCVNQPGRKFFPAPGEVNAELISGLRKPQLEPEEAWRISLNFAQDFEAEADKTWLKHNFQHQHKLQSKPALVLTLRTHFKSLCTLFEHKEYNPRGQPGPTIDEKNETKKWLKINFISSYKSHLEDYENGILSGKNLEIPYDITSHESNLLTQLENESGKLPI